MHMVARQQVGVVAEVLSLEQQLAAQIQVSANLRLAIMDRDALIDWYRAELKRAQERAA